MKSQPVVSLFLKDRFWAWILVSRTLIIFSSAILAMGLLSIPIGYIHIHAILMLLGVRLFYYGIMWAQIPSYTGYIPHRILSFIALIMELIGILLAVVQIDLWPYLSSISILVLGSIYISKGLGTSWQKLPNTLTILGIAHASLSLLLGLDPLYSISFPLLSAISMMIRVEPSMFRYNVSKDLLAIYILISGFLLLLSFYLSFKIIMLIPAMLVLILNRVSFKNIYGIGSTVAKALGIIGSISIFLNMQIDSLHIILVGFLGVIMGSLCGPLIVPGIMGRSYKEFSPGYAIAIALIAILRAIYREISMPFYIEVISFSMITLIFVYILKIMTSKRVV